MAKGARSSVKKRNKANLRAKVFGPVADQRTERLSAKLQELASKTSVKDTDMADADFNLIEKLDHASTNMDIDENSGGSKPESSGTGRIQKRVRRKTRPSITFKPHPGKVKRSSKKK
ncbi:hypothetical protein D8B26_000794 [Coccidioides posadasii str. Silveira]|uniref:Uncharacterized protein n=3 Tax=Coccidioides posadasii TaxID=199306 RepID=E9CS18_COCPS|nr:hypothetical protein CPC735_037540 [Coccidioides posadasii C735 delta SOWgp]EER29048.1 hypothetical protein CPC735_037540 [Coccidioides posadasii C735 delta SOWgp]EFW22541.1 conserved hypothetical protein [Coccidioides posadasii str. Silveira]KMM63916.1 hypothetical protein CPAG_00269 [Coccidioides posadasii RMSCC 3488]QVM06081.1 hypothetical protein D8B26_000794 [Coccidioides posadasii str. Silveira]|eukprot:XP_003071193.1 hypothetical protein CPC735_037540 [Coccidioides posadasii C735 delta SOWgp]